MDLKPQRDAPLRCATCGQPVDTFFSVPDCGAFMACGCAPRPVAIVVPATIWCALAAGTITAASFLISLR